jgi:hypothetical protein
MPESASLPELSRRRLLSGIAAIPAGAVLAGAVLAATTSRPGSGPAAKAPAPHPAWPTADIAAADFSRVYFC